MGLPIITAIERYKRLLCMEGTSRSARNVVCLLVPYTYGGIPRGTVIYYIMFSQSIYRRADIHSKIQLGIIHCGTCLTGRIYIHQNYPCRYL